MIDLSDIRRDDRVLSLFIPDTSLIRELAAKLTFGLLVTIGPDEDVRKARRECSELDNVMFVPVDASGSVPWHDAFFTVAICPRDLAQYAEVRRVLVPNARIVTIDL